MDNTKELNKFLKQKTRLVKELASEGDIIIITGKGCEQAICLPNSHKVPWDDRLVLKEEIIKLT